MLAVSHPLVAQSVRKPVRQAIDLGIAVGPAVEAQVGTISEFARSAREKGAERALLERKIDAAKTRHEGSAPGMASRVEVWNLEFSRSSRPRFRRPSPTS